ncbi:MAG: hypothetical protein Q9187_003389 [Circinaria calcarea]
MANGRDPTIVDTLRKETRLDNCQAGDLKQSQAPDVRYSPDYNEVFSTALEAKNHGSQHKAHKCCVKDCNKSFKQRQQLDRHQKAVHETPIEYYHCATEGCKYSSSGWPAQKSIREDHVKAHIKWYGHYGPQSPGNRKKRQGSELGKHFTVSVLFEKWNVDEEGQVQRSLISTIFTSPQTELWYNDEVGEQFLPLKANPPLRQEFFFCQERSCYYHETAPGNLPPTPFASSEYLRQHERRTGHNSLDGSGRTHSSLQVTTSGQLPASLPTFSDLQPVYDFPHVTGEHEYSWLSPYYESQSGDTIPWHPQQLAPLPTVIRATGQVLALQAMGTRTESISADAYTDSMDFDDISFDGRYCYDTHMGPTALTSSLSETQEDPHVSINWTPLEDSQLPLNTETGPFQSYSCVPTHLLAGYAHDRLTFQPARVTNVSQNQQSTFAEVGNLGNIPSTYQSLPPANVGSFGQVSRSTLTLPTSDFHDGGRIAPSASYTPVLRNEGE